MIYDFNDQIVEPFHEIHDAEPRTTGNHGTSKRAEKAAIKKLLSNSRYLLPVHDRPAKIEGGMVVGRLHDQVPGPIVQSLPAAQLVPGLNAEKDGPMTHVTLRPEFENLIDPYAPVGQVGTGFDFTEGPIWHPVDHYLLFSDMPGDVRRRWDAERGVAEVRRPSNKCNGMTYDADLNLIVCEHATSSLDPRAAGRTARGARLAFRGPGAQQPERRLRALRRLDLFLRSLVWPHAGLWRRAAAPARLPGRLSRAAGRRRAAAAGRPPSVRPAERPLLLARRDACFTSTTPCRR